MATKQDRHVKQAHSWMTHSHKDYDSAFDLAVECADELDLYEICEINGDRMFVPVWLVELAETFIPRGVLG